MRIGVDLGGTKIEAIAIDPAGLTLIQRRIDTPQGNYAATLAALVSLVHGIESELKCVASVGVGMPGSLSPLTGLVRNANSTCLNGKPFKEDLQSALSRAVRVANDANCFALSEAMDGAGARTRVLFGAILGTGVGSGIVVDQKVLEGANGIAGEWGHNPLPLPSPLDLPLPPCYCGRTGCIETYLSGPGLTREFFAQTGEKLDAASIAARAAAGDLACHAALSRYEERLARALAGVINLLDPGAIVLGGGLSRINRLYDRVPVLWRPYIFSDKVVTRLLPPEHGDASGTRGAAWLWN